MRSRAIREGSVGLLILLGLGLFGFLLLWLRGFKAGERSYQFTVAFDNVGGMRTGAPVRYRGVVVGQVVALRPGVDNVEADVEIDSSTLHIARDSLVQVNQAGLIGEISVDITPNTDLTDGTVALNPLKEDCKGNTIVCDGDYLTGEVGVGFNELISSTVELSRLVSDPVFFNELRTLARNTSDAAASVAVLSREVTRLSQSVERELTALSASASATTVSFGRAADQIALTATQVNTLLAENRVTINRTLASIDETAQRLQLAIGDVDGLLGSDSEFVSNLQILSANVTEASNNLRDLSVAVGSSENLLLLQQTLDSARATFQNAQKITADLDELTGDPAFRSDLRDLVNGLSNLVSHTNQLQQQMEMAEMLTAAQLTLNSSPPAEASAPQSPEPRIAPDAEEAPINTEEVPTTTEIPLRLEPYPDPSASPISNPESELQ